MNIFVQLNVKRGKISRVAKSFEIEYEGKATIISLIEYLCSIEESYAVDTFMTDNIVEIPPHLLDKEAEKHMYSIEKYDKAFLGDARKGYSLDIVVIEEEPEEEYKVYDPYS